MSLLSRAESLLEAIPRVDQLRKADQTAKQVRAKTSDLRAAREEYVDYRARGGVLDPRVSPEAPLVRKALPLVETYRDQVGGATPGPDDWLRLKRSLTSLTKAIKEGVHEGVDLASKPLAKASKNKNSQREVVRALGREADYLALEVELAALRAKDWKSLPSSDLASVIQRTQKFLANWEKLGLENLPEAVERFLAQVHSNGASLADFEADGVREWLLEKKFLSKVRLVFRE